jgi:hypothetical protein
MQQILEKETDHSLNLFTPNLPPSVPLELCQPGFYEVALPSLQYFTSTDAYSAFLKHFR